MEVRGATESKRRRVRMPKRRMFTLEHANRSLPLITRIVSDIVHQHKIVSALEEQCGGTGDAATQDDLDAIRERYLAEIDKLRDLARELTEIGVELKDWRRGLVDFPSTLEGRDIYLCWRLGEREIEFWHDLDVGFPGRRPIDDAFLAAATGEAAEPVA